MGKSEIHLQIDKLKSSEGAMHPSEPMLRLKTQLDELSPMDQDDPGSNPDSNQT